MLRTLISTLRFGLLLTVGTFAVACREPAAPELPWAEDPIQPAGRRVVGLTIAFQTHCAHVDTGALLCWGENRFGEFGDGTSEHSNVPVLGAGGMQFEEVFGSKGTSQMCGITSDHRAYCWGYNFNGELGDGTSEVRFSPVPVAGDLRFRMISSSYHTCGIDLDGRAYCWGSDLGGQLGDGDHPGDKLTPTPVATTQTYTTLANGLQFTCALRTTGEADCWGWGVGLGSGPGDRSVNVPTPVTGGRKYTRVAAASEWACALDTRGAPYCWGKAGPAWPNDFRSAPEAVPTQLAFREIAAASLYGACGLTAEGEAYCWTGRNAPAPLPGRHRWAGITAGGVAGGEYCGFTPGGSAYCWGWVPVVVNGVTRWVLGDPVPIPALPAPEAGASE